MRSYNVWLVPAAVMLVGLGLGNPKADAQTTSNFSIIYNTEFNFPLLDENFQPAVVEVSPLVEDLPPQFQEALPDDLPSQLINPQILDVQVTGESVDPNPPFGLTNFISETFGLPLPPQTNPNGQPERQVSIFRADPADLNINLPTPEFSDVYFGDETGNRLFGLANDQGIFDFVEGTIEGGGIITIVGGEGIFEGASGQIAFTQRDLLGPPGATVRGEATLNFQVVPEPGTVTGMLVSIGAIGAGVLRHRRRRHGACG